MKKSDDKIAAISDCPPLEQLSGFFDNALQLPPATTEHIATCPTCTQRLAEFRILEISLKRHLSATIPEDLIENIKAGVHQEMTTAHKSAHHFPGMFLKIAAAFAIISFAIFYGSNLFRPTTEKYPVRKIYPAQAVPRTNQENGDFTPYYANRQPDFWPNAIAENSIPLDNIIGANYGGSREPVFQVNNLPDTQNATVLIAQSVYQVWMAQHPELAVKQIDTILKQLKVSPSSTKIEELNGEFNGTVKLTKMQLVKLVRQCKQAGLDLLSPQAPQPEQNKFSGSPDTRVEYNFTITSPSK